MKKRIFVILLSVAVMFTFMPAFSAYAGSWKTDAQGNYYYYDDYGRVVKGWIEFDDSCYYGDPSTGKLWQGWKKISGHWYYFETTDEWIYDTGHMYDGGTTRISGKYYYFGTQYDHSKWGKLQYGWIYDGYDDTGEWWYYGVADNDGQLARGWRKIGGKWYYFSTSNDINEACRMNIDDLYSINGTIYAFGTTGALLYGWQKFYLNDAPIWVYANSDGVVQTGWKKISGTWYHFDNWGIMTANDWAKDSAGWMYMDANGKPVKGKWIQVDGSWYYMKSSGYMAANQWAKDSGGWMWLNKSGKITRSAWIQDGGYWYYLKSNGYMATGTQTIDGKTYKFDSQGRWIK